MRQNIEINLVEKTSSLTTTHQITMSKNKFNKFVDVIKDEGIKEPIKHRKRGKWRL